MLYGLKTMTHPSICKTHWPQFAKRTGLNLQNALENLKMMLLFDEFFDQNDVPDDKPLTFRMVFTDEF